MLIREQQAETHSVTLSIAVWTGHWAVDRPITWQGKKGHRRGNRKQVRHTVSPCSYATKHRFMKTSGGEWKHVSPVLKPGTGRP